MKHFFLLGLLTAVKLGHSQLPDYYVYLVGGEVSISKAGGKPVVVKQKDLVFKTDTLKLNKGATLTLVDKDASFLSLNGPLICVGKSLAARANKTTTNGVTAKYLHLLYNELLNPSADFEKFKNDNVAGIRAGVSRGEGCNNRIFPVSGVKTSSPVLKFKWRASSPSSDYSFEIYDKNAKQLFKKNVKDTFYAATLGDMTINKPGTYSWRVISKDGKCEDDMPIYFEIVTASDEQEMVSRLTSGPETRNIASQLNAIDKLEKNGLIDAAVSVFSSLRDNQSDNKAIMKSYVAFLIKYGFENEARTAWKP